jgi:LPXTG-motif cell wall-anchored protein
LRHERVREVAARLVFGVRATLALAAALSTGVAAAPAYAQSPGLDLATAAFVAAFDDASYSLCGESDVCSYEPALCVRLGASVVDCVVSRSGSGPRRCGVVIRAVLRGPHLFHGHYPCHGRLRPLVATRFVRFETQVGLRRFRAGIDWPASDEKNLYGVPRYDTRREVYTGVELPLTGASPWWQLLLGLTLIGAGGTLRARTSSATAGLPV